MEYLFRKISLITSVRIARVTKDWKIIEDLSNTEKHSNPFFQSHELIENMVERIKSQTVPVLYQDENKVFFGGIQGQGDTYYLFGPVCVENLSYIEIHRFYKTYHMKSQEEQSPVQMSFQRILAVLELLCTIIEGKEYEDEQILKENGLLMQKKEEGISKREQLPMTEEQSHHTYQEEVRTMEFVRTGNLQSVLEESELLASTAGILSEDALRHERNLGICSVTLATRAAIEGGVSPAKAYQLSDEYINKIDKNNDITELFEYRRRCLYDFAKLVADEKTRKRYSGYVEQCRDYIDRHYHEKIYLSDIADALGVSESYLSHLYKRETEESIQEYIVRFRVERAANLLKYSNASLSEVSDYVNFNSQSHFGKVFKQYKHVTPRQYREQSQPKEFAE